MAVPSSKEELIKAINSNFSLLNKKLDSFTSQLLGRAGVTLA